jgi:hypothetical protein
MRLSGFRKIALGLLGTILLGALGSGLWDLALKPGGRWLNEVFLTAVTLGSDYLKDQVYAEAARGYHEAAAADSYELLILFASWGLAASQRIDPGAEETGQTVSRRVLGRYCH